MTVGKDTVVEVEGDIEEALLPWLPVCILNDVKKANEKHQDNLRFSSKKGTYDKHIHRPTPLVDDRKSQAATPAPILPKLYWKPKSSMTRGSGMQAIFLQSGQRSCGTGVFLPHITRYNGANTKKSVSTSVLLPAHVVHVLNLNVPTPGTQTKSQDINKTIRQIEPRNTKRSELSSQMSKIFLPKEWTY